MTRRPVSFSEIRRTAYAACQSCRRAREPARESESSLRDGQAKKAQGVDATMGGDHEYGRGDAPGDGSRAYGGGRRGYGSADNKEAQQPRGYGERGYGAAPEPAGG